jgi:hypothetical protein
MPCGTRFLAQPLPAIRMKNKEDIIEYISIYCTDFYNEVEKKAMRHYVAQVKFLPYKDRVEKMTIAYHRDNSNEPEVLKLLENGIQDFHRNAAERVLNEHFNELTLNTCPKCGGIARTPTAKQCRYCKHNWH